MCGPCWREDAPPMESRWVGDRPAQVLRHSLSCNRQLLRLKRRWRWRNYARIGQLWCVATWRNSREWTYWSGGFITSQLPWILVLDEASSDWCYSYCNRGHIGVY